MDLTGIVPLLITFGGFAVTTVAATVGIVFTVHRMQQGPLDVLAKQIGGLSTRIDNMTTRIDNLSIRVSDLAERVSHIEGLLEP